MKPMSAPRLDLTSRSSQKLIALIDDDPLVADATQGLLRAWGYQVVTASSNAAAVTKLRDRTHRPDLIMSDYRVSRGQTSIQIIDQLRVWLRAAVPVLLISGDSVPEHLRDLCVSGYRLLNKPTEPERLRVVVQQLLMANK